MKNKKPIKLIITTEPGVDDAACLALLMNDPAFDIKLITTLRGNVPLEKSTRNMLHLLDLFDKDLPVAKGEKHALERNSPTAEFIHQKEGLGGYIPPRTTIHKCTGQSAVEQMYHILKEGDGDIFLLVLSPHTNVGKLLKDHPDIIPKIPAIYFEGGSPYGAPGFSDHISFNISSDPEAFKLVLDSKIPLYMIPSDMGRKMTHLSEEFVIKLKKLGDVGNLIFQMSQGYWEPGYPDRRHATNDTCAYYLMKHPKIFTLKQCDVVVDCDLEPGKTYMNFSDQGNVELAVSVNRKKFLKLFYNQVKNLKKIKLKNFTRV